MPRHLVRAEQAWARDVVARRRRERDELIATAGRFADLLPDDLRITAVVVFGSVARGDFNRWSDIDVLVVAENIPAGGSDRLPAVQPDAPTGVQPVVWTPTELSDRRRRKDPIAVEADALGVVVRGSLVGP